MSQSRATSGQDLAKATGFAIAMLAVDYLLSGHMDEGHHHHHHHDHPSILTAAWNIACVVAAETASTSVRFFASGVSGNCAYTVGTVDFVGYALLSRKGWFSLAGRGFAAAATAFGVNRAVEKLLSEDENTAPKLR